MSWRILHGDVREQLATLPGGSVDACVTDPPYGIGFMGKEWDNFRRSRNPGDVGRESVMGRLSMMAPASGAESDMRAFQEWTEAWAREVLRVLKPGGHALVCGAPRSFHRMACGLEDAGFEIRDCLSWLYGQGFPKSLNLGDGIGTALKPGWEPIVLARKPFSGTVKANVEQYGTGALNIDACRLNPGEPVPGGRNGKAHNGGRFGAQETHGSRPVVEPHSLGRWPANVVLDEAAAAMLDEQSGVCKAGGSLNGTEPSRPAKNTYGDYNDRRKWESYADSGGASRFYYMAKPSREERDYGCQDLQPQQRDESRKEGNPGGDNPRNRGLQKRGNHHPTVKPVELMRWLVKLVTPINGTVLDPFMGSGTTGMACQYEQRGFIGIEREAEYIVIAERRIGAVAPLFATEDAAGSPRGEAGAG